MASSYAGSGKPFRRMRVAVPVGEQISEGDLLGSAEIGLRLGIGRQRVGQVVGRAGFPEPIAILRQGRIWHTGDVEAWIEESRPWLRLMRVLTNNGVTAHPCPQ